MNRMHSGHCHSPVAYELGKTLDLQLHFVNGPTVAPAAVGISQQYEGPYCRFFNPEAPSLHQLAYTARLATESAPNMATPEDHGRIMREHGLADVDPTNVYSFIQEQIDGGPFDGILGFSEGASAAATWLLQQATHGATPHFDFAVFFCGTPPVSPHGSRDIALADELTDRINIPTAHIIGSKDPGYKNSLALFNLCERQSATCYDHGKDHTIPWDPRVTQAIAEEIRAVVQRSREDNHKK
ncbi:MAG: hypothetical protein Q9181_003069 [Wetmoreana brouardii]